VEHQDCVVEFSIAASSLCGGLSQFAILHQVLHFYYTRYVGYFRVRYILCEASLFYA
jgi:hypothetical protein